MPDEKPIPDHAYLRLVGEALYGEQWQSSLARDLEVSFRTMTRWAHNKHPIPPNVWIELAVICKQRVTALTLHFRDLKKRVKNDGAAWRAHRARNAG